MDLHLYLTCNSHVQIGVVQKFKFYCLGAQRRWQETECVDHWLDGWLPPQWIRSSAQHIILLLLLRPLAPATLLLLWFHWFTQDWVRSVTGMASPWPAWMLSVLIRSNLSLYARNQCLWKEYDCERVTSSSAILFSGHFLIWLWLDLVPPRGSYLFAEEMKPSFKKCH